MEDYRKRKLQGYETQGQNIKTKYDKWLVDIWRSQEADYYFKVANLIQDKQNQWSNSLASWNQNPNSYDVNSKPTLPTTWYTMQEVNDKNLLTKPKFY
jgi:hypothetical protein